MRKKITVVLVLIDEELPHKAELWADLLNKAPNMDKYELVKEADMSRQPDGTIFLARDYKLKELPQ